MFVSSHVHTDATNSTKLVGSSLPAQRYSSHLQSSPTDTATFSNVAFGCKEDPTDSTKTPSNTKPKKTYTRWEKVASRFKLKKLSLDPRRLEGNILLSLIIGAFTGFSLTPVLFLAFSILSIWAGLASKKPVDIKEVPMTLPEDQLQFKKTYQPVIRTLGHIYQTLGQIALHYDKGFKQLNQAGNLLQTLDLGSHSDELKDSTADALTLLYFRPEEHSIPFMQPDTTADTSSRITRIHSALNYTKNILDGELPQSTEGLSFTKINELSILKENSNTVERYQQLKAHQDHIIDLVQLAQQISPTINQKLIKPNKLATLADLLTQFTNDMPVILHTAIPEAEALNTQTKTYGDFLEKKENKALLKQVQSLLHQYIEKQPAAFQQDALHWFNFEDHEHHTLTASLK